MSSHKRSEPTATIVIVRASRPQRNSAGQAVRAQWPPLMSQREPRLTNWKVNPLRPRCPSLR